MTVDLSEILSHAKVRHKAYGPLKSHLNPVFRAQVEPRTCAGLLHTEEFHPQWAPLALLNEYLLNKSSKITSVIW